MNRLEAAITAVRAGGAEILSHNPDTARVMMKSGESDVVTSADLASDAAVTKVLSESLPGDVVVSEESDAQTRKQLYESDFTGWVIDPLDGTNAFRDRMNYSGVSVGYIENGEPVVGAVYDPYRDELVAAERGRGARLNDRVMKVGQRLTFDKSTRVAFSNTYRDGGTRESIERHLRLPVVPWTICLGSSVLIARDIVAGRIDLYHHNGLSPWDNAAMFLIILEAGGKITGVNGEPVTWTTDSLVMGNTALVDEFVKLTAPVAV
ncbi:MAG: inositol monophosphatase family protein [Candidatus Saccharibacteria bacterium]|nr:inositol monophosphatase family protein [Candidatus Saccharibacteria bacterium]